MAFSTTTLAKDAFKVLNGKAHTSNAKELANESKAAWVQLPSSRIFGETINSSPAQAVLDGVAELVIATLTIDPTTTLSYQAIYPVGHAKAGQVINNIIPQSFGTGFRPVLTNNNGAAAEVPPLHSSNWFCTTSAGIVTSETALSLVNGTLTCYVYIGKMVDEVIADVISGGSTSGRDIITLDGTDISNGYVDLTHLVHTASIVMLVKDGPAQFPGFDFTPSTVGGVTRVTFAGDAATLLVSGDQLAFQYTYTP